jgi:murein DD-endopeptidase MepM/ murein hydrolase activator NlpD
MMRVKDLVIMLLLATGTVLTAYLVPPIIEPQANPELQTGRMEAAPAPPSPARTLYGIPVSSYRIVKEKVRKGESLAELLYPHQVSTRQIYQISLLHDSLIDERRIKPGHAYTVFITSDTIPAYFVYEKDPLNYVRIRFDGDSVSAQNALKPLEQRVQFASGTIESSLWESMREIEVHPLLAVELSEIFAWSIDFFGVQQGDQYKVIYEESFVDSVSIGINKILGAWFYHNNTDFWGIPFDQGGVRSFFDENGNSLRKAFLKAPLRFSRISSGFSHSRYHPVLKIRRPHHGVDYVAPTGTPVYSVGDGVVSNVGYQKGG